MAPGKATPVYVLGSFSEKAKKFSFYIEALSTHLRDHAFVNAPHKHDFFLVLYITRGGGTHAIDFKNYTVKPGNFFVMTPGQVHSWQLEKETEGYIIFFEADFYQLSNPLDLPFFGSLAADPLIDPGDDPTPGVIVREMYKEKDIKVIRAWLEVLLLKLSGYYKHPADGETNTITYKIRKLEQLIEKNFIKLKKPADYADLMNLSTAYLNNLCKRHLGKTLSDLINERIVLESKRLFAYTDLTSAQVSGKLKFADPSYFARFFRKNSGMTPEQFKESTIRPIR